MSYLVGSIWNQGVYLITDNSYSIITEQDNVRFGNVNITYGTNNILVSNSGFSGGVEYTDISNYGITKFISSDSGYSGEEIYLNNRTWFGLASSTNFSVIAACAWLSDLIITYDLGNKWYYYDGTTKSLNELFRIPELNDSIGISFFNPILSSVLWSGINSPNGTSFLLS